MNKRQFLNKLRGKLNGLSEESINEHIAFFSEMIDDRIEEGLSEREAIAAIGSLDLLIPEIMATNTENESEFKERKKMSAASIVVLAIGSVVWAPILLAVIAIVFTLIVSMWAVLLALWLGLFLGFAISSPIGITGGIIIAVKANPLTGAFLIGLTQPPFSSSKIA